MLKLFDKKVPEKKYGNNVVFDDSCALTKLIDGNGTVLTCKVCKTIKLLFNQT